MTIDRATRPSPYTRRGLLMAAVGTPIGLALSACAPGTTGTGSAPPTGPLKAGTKLVVVSPGGDRVPLYEQYAKTFQDQNAGVTVEIVSTADANRVEKVLTMLTSGTQADLFTFGATQTPTWVERGLLRPLDDLVRRDKYDLSDFFEPAVEQYRWKGKLYALSRGFGHQDIYYNTTLWDTTGLKRPAYDWKSTSWTVEEFLDATTRLTRGSGGGDGTKPVWGYVQRSNTWEPWVWNFGGEILNKAGTACTLDQPQAVEGLQFLQDLIHKHRVMAPPSAKVNPRNAMGTGEVVMGLDNKMDPYRGLATTHRLQFDAAPLPRKVRRMTTGGGVGWHMASAVKDANAAWALHKWLAGSDLQQAECAAGEATPTRKSVTRSTCFADRSLPPKGIDAVIQSAEFVHPDPQAVGWPSISDEINFDALWTGEKTARQIVTEFVPRVNALLKQHAR